MFAAVQRWWFESAILRRRQLRSEDQAGPFPPLNVLCRLGRSGSR